MGFFLEGIKISELPILTKHQDDQVVKGLCFLGPLSLDDPCTCPTSLGDVVGVLFLPGAVGTAVTAKRSTGKMGVICT